MFKDRNPGQDLAALVVVAAAVLLGIALVTFDPTDPPTPLAYPPSSQVHNACGRLGASAAHASLHALGIGAYYLVISLGVVGFYLFRQQPVDQPVLRTAGWVMSLCGFCTLLAALLPGASPRGLVVGSGGYLGAMGRSFLELHFAPAGAWILIATVLAVGLLLSTDYVLLQMAGHLAGAGLMVGGRVLSPLMIAAGRKSSEPDEEDEDWDEEELEDDVEAEEEEDEEEEDEEEYDEDEQDAYDEEDDEGEGRDKDQSARRARGLRVRSSSSSARAAEGEDKPLAEGRSRAQKGERRGVKGRLASALRMARGKRDGRTEVMVELDAASRRDETPDYELPPIDLLLKGESISLEAHEKEVRRKAKILEKTFSEFGYRVKVVEIETGPVIAQYEVQLEAGLRLSKITGLADDLAIALRVPSVRIVAPIPGKNTVGIEVPNENRHLVRLREVIEEANGRASRMKIPIFLGKDVAGSPMLVDLTALPHLLIAGRTGTGKSVCLNSIIASMLMTRRPDEVRMLMIDPKMVELSPYKRLPHLMHPVVTDMRKAEAILAWAVEKMEERYAILARAGVRHVSVYNQLGDAELRERMHPESDEEWSKIPKHLPFIVIIADEMADLMMTCGKEVEQHIIRLAQKSRAVGIHLILATQKPTVDVITGLIKSNLPARIAFQVASRTDSRVVLDEMGADKLLGNGDLLFLLPGTSTLLRGQGTYLTDDEINRLVDAVGTSEPQFVRELVQLKVKEGDASTGGKLSSRDELYESAVDVVVREGRGSVSLLQRALGIGYGRAARLIDFMAEDGIVGAYNGSQARDVLISVEDWEAMSRGAGSTATPDSAGGGLIPARCPAWTADTAAGDAVAAKSPDRFAVDDEDEIDEEEVLEDDADSDEDADEEDMDDADDEVEDEEEIDEDVEEEEEEDIYDEDEYLTDVDEDDPLEDDEVDEWDAEEDGEACDEEELDEEEDDAEVEDTWDDGEADEDDQDDTDADNGEQDDLESSRVARRATGSTEVSGDGRTRGRNLDEAGPAKDRRARRRTARDGRDPSAGIDGGGPEGRGSGPARPRLKLRGSAVDTLRPKR
jgi:S-DNA-T family DNA segregation ATPase FtsK/SpoIIIE